MITKSAQKLVKMCCAICNIEFYALEEQKRKLCFLCNIKNKIKKKEIGE